MNHQGHLIAALQNSAAMDSQRRRHDSDELAKRAARHADTAAGHGRELAELYGRPRKSVDDWSKISELARLTEFGLAAANVQATLALRQAYLAGTTPDDK